MKTIAIATIPFTFALSACGSTAASEVDEEATVELSRAGAAILGAYIERGAGDLRSLVLTTEVVSRTHNRFFANVDSGVLCRPRPGAPRVECPMGLVRIEGKFSATKTTLRLIPDVVTGTTLDAAIRREVADRVAGRYLYDHVALSGGGAKLRLEKTMGDIDIPGSLEQVPSYCDSSETAERDCRVQGLAEPLCGGGSSGFIPRPSYRCSAESTCEFFCTQPPVACTSLDAATCGATPQCFAVRGPSWCTPDGRCSRDFVFKRCIDAPF